VLIPAGMKLITKVVSLSVLSTLCLTAFGETLAEQKEEKDVETRLAKTLESANKDCGGLAITGSIDWASFQSDGKHGRNAYGGMCIAAASQIGYMCRRYGADGQAKVRAKIKQFECHLGDPEATTLHDGVMSSRVSWKNVNPGDNVAKALGDQL
jgi:hypothetical protein